MSTAAAQFQASDALDALLAGYAAGTLAKPLYALVGAHLELSEKNRHYVRSLEASLGRRLENGETQPMRRRDERLAAIFSSVDREPTVRRAAPVQGRDPRALVHFLGRPIDELNFKTLLPGIREFRAESEEGMTAVLYRIRAGRKMPQHTHHGAEITLVLRGSFADADGEFRAGDIALTDEHVDHVPVAGGEEECVCFAVLDAPLKLTGFFGRLANPFLPH